MSFAPFCGYLFSRETADFLHGQAHRRTGVGARNRLELAGFKFRAVPYARFAGEKDKNQRGVYESANCGAGKGHPGIHRVRPGAGSFEAGAAGLRNMLNPELLLPYRRGESGKGDFLRPLCIAGATSMENVVKAWKRCRHPLIPKTFPATRKYRPRGVDPQDAGLRGEHRHDGNEAYNRLYAK